MNLDGPTATVIAAMAAVLIAFVGFVASVHFRLGKLEKGHEVLEKGQEDLRADNAALREQVRADNQQLREEMRENNRQLREEMREEMRENNRQLREEMRENNRQLREEMRELIRSESEATRTEIRRLVDALVSHHHEADGSIVFRIPPPQDAGD